MKTLTGILFFLSVMLLSSCNKKDTLSVNGWTVEIDAAHGSLSFANEELGTLLTDVNLIASNHKKIKLKHWSYKLENNTLKITTKKPDSSWSVSLTDDGIDFSTNLSGASVSGIAPAPEKRIPARTAEQDNDVMYTQMGFVSAANIHNLFDMNTDIMINFPDNSRLTRNENPELMAVTFKPVKGNDIKLIREYYDEVVGLSKYDLKNYTPQYSPIGERFKTAPTGWSSWYCYYMAPSEASLFAETDAIAEKLKDYGIRYIQLDAAYSRGDSANWLVWYKGLYPSGGKAWFNHVIDKGFIPGLWLNIFGDNHAKPSMADKYPENYFLHDKEGKLSPACCSADKTVKRLDYTNPDVIEKHLKPLFETLVNDWGLGYLKAGGWGTWMDFYEKNRSAAFDSTKNSREIYRETHKVLRDILGDTGYLLGCAMHEIGVGFDYMDGSRTGGDDYAEWTGKNHWSGGMQTFFNSLFGANYLNGICWWSDPDDVMVRDPLTMDEGKTIVSTISLSGQAYVFSDFVADFSKERLSKFLNSKFTIGWAKNFPHLVKPLPEDKLDLYRKTMPAMPIRAMDLYAFKTKAKCCPKPKSFPKALDLKVNAETGQYDVVSIYNWSDVDTIRTIDLASDLSLEEGKYLAFDFWNTKMVDVSSNMIEQSVPSHGTLALIIRKDEAHPQLMGTSRHLTSAYSIRYYKWDADTKIISGKSDVIPGKPYTLYVHVPKGYKTKNLKVNSSAEKTSVKQMEEELLGITFNSPDASLTWSIHF
jgi:hypothetical protein